MGLRNGKLGEYIVFAEPIAGFIPFSGVCKIDEANPDTASPGSNSAYNQADSWGEPRVGEREWLLVKCARPFQSSTETDPGQEAHFPMELTTVVHDGCKYWWYYDLITQDFEVSGDDCATWNTKPTMAFGTDGIIGWYDGSDGVKLWPMYRHLSCCHPGFTNERTTYGICLRPYLWYLGDEFSYSIHEIDYRKWLVRL